MDYTALNPMLFIPKYDFLLCVTHNTIRLGHSSLNVKLMYTTTPSNGSLQSQPNRTLLFLWQTGNCIPHSETETAYQEGKRRTRADNNTNKKLTKWNEEMATDYFKPGGETWDRILLLLGSMGGVGSGHVTRKMNRALAGAGTMPTLFYTVEHIGVQHKHKRKFPSKIT